MRHFGVVLVNRTLSVVLGWDRHLEGPDLARTWGKKMAKEQQ